MGYRITTVSRLTGIPRNTLLAWERRYALVEPGRSGNGYRDYSEADVEYLKRVKQLVDSGYKISEAISLVRESELRAAAPVREAGSDRHLSGLQDDLLESLFAFDRTRAVDILRHAELLGYERRVRELFVPTLRQVGDRWQAGEVSIGQEHFATAFLRERLLAILVGLGFGPARGPRVVCACVAGERHDGGLLALAVLIALRGHRVVWLGADLPRNEVLAAARTDGVRMVCLSAMDSAVFDSLVPYVSAIRCALPDQCEVIVGGAAIASRALPTLDGIRWEADIEGFLDRLGQPPLA